MDYPFISPWVLLDVFESRCSIDFQGVSGPSKVAQVPLRDSVDPPSASKARSLWAMFHWGRGWPLWHSKRHKNYMAKYEKHGNMWGISWEDYGI